MSDFFDGNQRVDLLELQRRFQDVLGPEGFDENDMSREVRKLRILPFHIDRKKTNIVSQIDGTIVFVQRDYLDRVAEGDLWLCSVYDTGTVYNAIPLLKITAATAMDFSDNIREGITDALWEKNKKAYLKIFEEKYREEVYNKAIEEEETKHKDIIESLTRKIEDLTNQLEQSRFVIESRRTRDMEFSEEEITLGATVSEKKSEDNEEEEIQLTGAPSVSARMPEHISPQFILRNSSNPVPGLPELRITDSLPSSEQISRKYRVERLDPRTLYSDSFADGKYFVHINLSKRFLIIRPNSYGQAICINHRMVLNGLDELSSFVGPKQLMAEWNPRYDGLLVYL